MVSNKLLIQDVHQTSLELPVILTQPLDRAMAEIPALAGTFTTRGELISSLTLEALTKRRPVAAARMLVQYRKATLRAFNRPDIATIGPVDQYVRLSPKKVIGFDFPHTLNECLYAYLKSLVQAGEKTTRPEFISCLIFHSRDRSASDLMSIVRAYRRAAIKDLPSELLKFPTQRRPGPLFATKRAG